MLLDEAHQEGIRNSCHQAWYQAPLPAKPSHWSVGCIFPRGPSSRVSMSWKRTVGRATDCELIRRTPAAAAVTSRGQRAPGSCHPGGPTPDSHQLAGARTSSAPVTEYACPFTNFCESTST
ncbi:rCG20358 [Rattus norvegicus]|uniref:RCG20358 n=1 Tax=Rattus norvegicus TaxID=10116 RepID=A6JGM0_RAT|nr:rCG20358 [Rattus norvegicus]